MTTYEGWFKLNFDGSVKNKKGLVGFIIKDSYVNSIIIQAIWFDDDTMMPKMKATVFKMVFFLQRKYELKESI